MQRRAWATRRINRDHSPVLALAVPVLSILAASVLTTLSVATAAPLLPPFGFVLLIAWRLQRPGLLAAWAGFPLGLFDDLVSGQPFGSAMLLWSLAMIALEALETRFPWRTFVQDWLIAGALLLSYIAAAALLSGASVGVPGLIALIPQTLLTIASYPLLARLVAWLDRLRLSRVRRIG